MNVACGTPGYVAPEILKGVAYGKEVDMWSIGVILYILLCGFPPFYDDNNKKLFAQIVNANYSFPDPYWTNISANAKDLVRKLLVVDARNRLSAVQVLAHPWMFEDNSGSSLDHFRPNLKSYNARRRFRSAIRAVQITQLLRNKTKAGNPPPTSILEVVEQQDNNMRSKSIDNSEIRDQIAAMVANTQAVQKNAMDIIPEATTLDHAGSGSNLHAEKDANQIPPTAMSSAQPSPAAAMVGSGAAAAGQTGGGRSPRTGVPVPGPITIAGADAHGAAQHKTIAHVAGNSSGGTSSAHSTPTNHKGPVKSH